METWNLTHYTYTCKGPKAAHRTVEFYTEVLPSPLHSSFSPAGLQELSKIMGFCRIYDQLTFFLATGSNCVFSVISSHLFVLFLGICVVIFFTPFHLFVTSLVSGSGSQSHDITSGLQASVTHSLCHSKWSKKKNNNNTIGY